MIAEAAKKKMKARRMTQQQLADEVGTTKATINRWHNSVNPNTSVVIVERVMEVLKIWLRS